MYKLTNVSKESPTKNINIPIDETLHHRVKVKLAEQKKQLNVLVPELLEIWVRENALPSPAGSEAAQSELRELSLDKRVRKLLAQSLEINVYHRFGARLNHRKLSWRDGLALAIDAWVSPKKLRKAAKKG